MTAITSGLCKSLTPAVVKLLKVTGVKTVSDFITENVELLAQKTAIPYKDLVAIRRVLLAQYSAFPTIGSEVYINGCSSLAFFSTWCESLDSVLDGGLYSGEVTELAGDIGAGKTQVCLSSVASVSSASLQNVVYIDTCGGFCAERLLEILQIQRRQQDLETIFSRIQCVQAHDIFAVFSSLESIRHSLTDQMDTFYSCVKLIVLDSVTSVVYPVLGGQQMDGHGLMVRLAQTLKMLAMDFSLAVLICNNLTWSDSGRRAASLGRTWSHMPHTRVVIEKSDHTSKRTATVVKSTRLAVPVTTEFTIPSLEADIPLPDSK